MPSDRTHHPDCWRLRGHEQCAVEVLERITSALDAVPVEGNATADQKVALLAVVYRQTENAGVALAEAARPIAGGSWHKPPLERGRALRDALVRWDELFGGEGR